MDPVYDCPLYEKHITDVMIAHLLTMEQRVKLVETVGACDGEADESSSSLDSIGDADSDAADEEVNGIEPLVTAATRVLQRRQHVDHD